MYRYCIIKRSLLTSISFYSKRFSSSTIKKLQLSMDAPCKRPKLIDSDNVSPDEEKLETTRKKVKCSRDVSDVTNSTSNSAVPKLRKKKVALMMIYSGKNYFGLQLNNKVPTVENTLIQSLLTSGLIPKEHAALPWKMNFQRASRTDKGVSSLCQVLSLSVWLNAVPDPVVTLNQNLPSDIRVINIVKTTRGFNCKKWCKSRTYIYLLPSFAFTPINKFVLENYRIEKETLEDIRNTLLLLCGTHNFHNFTSGRLDTDKSCYRYIMSFTCEDPFLSKDNIEYLIIRVKGQSFMLHQIRKMIGLVISVVRGLVSSDVIEEAYKPGKADIPKAPGLGLVLENISYDSYNDKFAKDNSHEKLEWTEYIDQIKAFRDEIIFPVIFETEKKEKSMIKWLQTLHSHHFDKKALDGSLDEEVGHAKSESLVNDLLNEKEDTEK